MSPMNLAYSFLHNMPPQRRRSELYELLNMLTEDEFSEVLQVLAQVQALRQAHTPLKVSLTP